MTKIDIERALMDPLIVATWPLNRSQAIKDLLTFTQGRAPQKTPLPFRHLAPCPKIRFARSSRP